MPAFKVFQSEKRLKEKAALLYTDEDGKKCITYEYLRDLCIENQ